MGPFDLWPTGEGIGFDYFYGFLAGETSQWEPRLFENLNAIEPPRDERYHFTEDMADKAIIWMKRHRAFAPDKPFLLYWAPGAGHGPHHIFKEWADKYKGKFDDGWDVMRERIFERQKESGWIPPNTKLTPRAASMPSWASIPEAERPFQLRLMEVFAGFVEHADVQAGKIIDELDQLGIRDNTMCSTFLAIMAPALKVRTAASASCSPRTRFQIPSSNRLTRSTRSAGLKR